jgi:putative N6-adenine-specific DNA methylase
MSAIPRTTLQYFSSCPRGLEPVLAAELATMGAEAIEILQGGVRFAGDMNCCYQVNLRSRIASRVLWQVAHGPYRKEDDVYQAALALPWDQWFKPQQTIRVSVTGSNCPLKSLDFITLRVKDAICDRFRAKAGARPNVDTAAPDMRIHAYLDATHLTLYLDTSGEPLYKRGLRRESNEAPLRENLAAGILSLAGWKPGTALLDPMCGSGTFLLEAAQISLGIQPGSRREFAFEKMKMFDQPLWQRLLAEAKAGEQPVKALPLFGSDLYGDALKAARSNFEQAGLIEAVNLKQANMLEVSAPAPSGIMVTNPPYGVRLGEEDDLAIFYPKLGTALKQKFSGWNCYILTADLRIAKMIRLSASKRTVLFNGNLECRLFEYKMVAGGNRKEKGSTDDG